MKRKRRILFWSGVAAAVLLLATVGSVLTLKSEWLRRHLRDRITSEMERVTGGRVELGDFRFDPGRMEARLYDLVLHGREDAGQPPLFRAASIEVRLKLLGWLKPSVDLYALVLTNPQVHLIVYPDGSTNLPAPKVPRISRKSAVEQILELAVDRFQLDQGVLLFQQRRIPLTVRAERFRTQWTYDFRQPAYQGDFSAARLDLTVASLKTLPLACEARLRLDGKRLELAPLKLAYRGSSAELTGSVQDWEAPRLRLRYVSHLRLDELWPALRLAELPRTGEAWVEGRAEMSAGESWAAGRARAIGLTVESRGVRVEGIQAVADFTVRPDGLEWQDLDAAVFGGRLKGRGRWSGWREIRFEGAFEELLLQRLLQAADRSGVPYQARLSGTLSLAAQTPGGKVEDWRMKTAADLAPEIGGQPLGGRVEAEYDARTATLSLAPSHLITPGTRVELSGVLGRQLVVNFYSTNLADLDPLLAVQPDSRVSIPITLGAGGSASFRGMVRGPLHAPELDGHLSLRSFRADSWEFESLETELEASPHSLLARRLRVQGRNLSATGSLRLGLQNWRPFSQGELNAALSVDTQDAARLLERLGAKLPVSGRLNADVMTSGTQAQPQFKARWELAGAVVYGERVERLAGEVSYRDGALRIRRIEAEASGARLELTGNYTHEKDDFTRGRLAFELAARGLDAGTLNAVSRLLPGAHARISGHAKGEIGISPQDFGLLALTGKATLARLSWQGVALGSLTLEASTSGSNLLLDARGKLAGANVQGQSRWSLEKEYAGSGAVTFGRMRLSDWLARVGAVAQRSPGAPEPEIPVEILAEGKLAFEAPTLAANAWKATLELNAVEMAPRTWRANPATFLLRNDGPWVIAATAEEARIRQARLVGKGAELDITGGFRFASRYPLNLRCRGAVDLGLLGELDPGLRSGGTVAVDASLRGSPARPDWYGRVDVRNAFLNYGDLPNGLDKINGILFLYRDRATIEKLTAESGGGKVNLQGFVAFGDTPTYWVQGQASDVRVRYPEGVSSTLNASLTLTGNPAQSVLGGELTLTRAAFHPQTDLGSLLVRSVQRPETPSHPFLENLRLDVRIRTGPQVRLETSLTRSLQAEADLRLRGTALRPALLGRALISQGEILFFGNRYTIDSGEILFVNPSRIEPVVNLHLATRVRGVEVTLNISGPLNKTTVTYRSDPPLPFSDIVALLATGRTPSTAPGLVGARSEFHQSWEQAGASALVSQAIASPLAGRLQRFLGVSRLKIDPTVRGIENTPEAHLTLEQQITPDVTLVYITNLARAQQQTIRLEWDFTRNFSALAVREANGLFGVDFLYKKRFK